MASLTLEDRIASLDAQIKDLNEQKALLEAELDLQTKVPRYIDKVVSTLVSHLGKSKKWEARIRKSLEENLKSTPKCNQESENAKRDIWIYTDFIRYKWNDENVEYSVELADDLYNAPADPSDYELREKCLIIYNSDDWKGFEDFDLKYIPVLFAYYNEDIEYNCDLSLDSI